MDGIFSKECLNSLLENSVSISAIILPLRSGITGKRLRTKNLLGQYDSIHDIAREAHIPVYELDKINNQTMDPVFSAIRPNLIVVACFPFRIPAGVYQRLSYGAYNLHPSLLPDYRGPVPLFWQFYHGEKNTGVTLHVLDEGYDTGDIIYQESVRFSDGISGADANRVSARKSAELVIRLLEQFESGMPERTKQVPDSGSYYSWPDIEHFSIPTQWSASRAYNFICATRHWHQAYTIRSARGNYTISTALTYDPDVTQDTEVIVRNQQLVFQFNPGILVTLSVKYDT